MPAKLLVAAKDLAPGVLKGDIVEIYRDEYAWSAMEVLPDFIRVVITNRSKGQVDGYLQSVAKIFSYSIDGQNAQGIRATISVDRSVSGALDLDVRQDLKDYILAGAGLGLPVTRFAQTPFSLTVDIEIADDDNRTPALQLMRDNINSAFAEIIRYRRYFFNPTAVDSVIASGGETSVNAAQAAANISDRLLA